MQEYIRLPNGRWVTDGELKEFCAVCGSIDNLERHHWAPKHLFKDRADDYPTSLLCKLCHSEWHDKMTPFMCGNVPRRLLSNRVAFD